MRTRPFYGIIADMKLFLSLLCLAFLTGISSAQRISDINSHVANDPIYQAVSPIDRMVLLSNWVGERRIDLNAVRLLVRRESTAFLDQQAKFSRGIGIEDLDPEAMETQYAQIRGGVGAGIGGGIGGIGAAGGIPNQRLVQEEIIARKSVEETIEDAMIQREFGGMLGGWYMLNNLTMRGQPLQHIEMPGDLMDEVCMRLVFRDLRWVDAIPRERLQVLKEVQLSRLWSPMLTQLAHAQIAQLLYEETKDLDPSESPLGQLTLLREFKRSELLSWGPFHEQTEQRLLLRFLDTHPIVLEGSAYDTLTLLRKMEREELISSMSRTKFELPYAMTYLEGNRNFQAMDADGKKAFIQKLRDERLIDFFSVSSLEMAFGLRGGRGSR